MESPNIKPIRCRFVAISSYDVENSVCAICKNPLTMPCIECYNNKKDSCMPSLGKCAHTFHYHCISKWLNTHNTCPIDNTPFNYEKEKLNNPHWKEQILKENLRKIKAVKNIRTVN